MKVTIDISEELMKYFQTIKESAEWYEKAIQGLYLKFIPRQYEKRSKNTTWKAMYDELVNMIGELLSAGSLSFNHTEIDEVDLGRKITTHLFSDNYEDLK